MPAFSRGFGVLVLPLLAATVGSMPSACADWTYAGESAGLSVYTQSSGTAIFPATAQEAGDREYRQSGGLVIDNGDTFPEIFGIHSTAKYVLTSGTLNLRNGVSLGDNASGIFEQSGGTATMSFLGLGLREIPLDPLNRGYYTISGGTLTAGSIVFYSPSASGSEFRLNGGKVVTSTVQATAAGTFYFNGGTLQADAAVASSMFGWMNSGITTYVSTGGAFLDTAGTNRDIYAAFNRDPAIGGGPDGGVTKLGGGTLTLYSALTYTGATTVQEGTLQLCTDPAFAYANGQMTGGGALVVNGGTFSLGVYNESLGSLSGTGGTISLNGKNLTLNQTVGGTYAGNITGAGSTLTKSGTALLKLSGTNTYTGGTTINAGALQFANASALASGGPLTVASGATAAFNIGGAGEFTLAEVKNLIGANFQNGAKLGLDVSNASGGAYPLADSFQDNGANSLGLVKLGQGALVLSGTNTYTGGTTVSSGTLQFAKTSALPAAGVLAVEAGATGAFNVGGAGEFTSAGIGGVTSGFQNGSWLGLDTSNAGGSFTLSHSLSGSFGLTKLGAGTLVLTGSSSFTGGVRVNIGAVEFANANSLGAASGVVALNTGTLRWGAGNTADISSRLNLGAGGGTLDTNGNFVTLANAIAGTGALTKVGTGTLALSGSNAFSGVDVIGGALQFANLNALGAVSGTVALNGGTLRWASGNTADISSRLNLGAGGGTIDTNGNTLAFANAISGTGALVKTGAGLLRLTAANAHSGDTTVNGGVIALAGPTTAHGQFGGLDGSRITINSGNINLEANNVLVGTNPYANILLTINSGGLLTTENNVNILPEVLLDGGAIEAASGGNLVTGNYIFSDGLRTAGTGKTSRIFGGAVALPTAVDVAGADTLRIESVIVGSNNLVKQGAGTLVLTGSNTYSGSTVLGGGVVDFNNASAFGNASGAITVNSSTLRWTGHATDISSRLTLGAGGGTFDTNGNSVTFASAISGTGALVKTGSGFLRLSAANAHSGDTTVNGGVIILSGPTTTRGQLGGLDGSRITINSGNINLETNNALVGTTPFSNILLTINTTGLLSTVNNTTILPEVVMDGGTIETAGGGDFVNGNYIFTDGLRTAGTGKLSSIQGGSVVLPTAVNVLGGDTLRLATVIMGSNKLVKQGAGTMLLTGSNTFTGTTIVSGGLVEFSSNASFGNVANKIAINGGGLRWATGNTTDISGRLNALGSAGATFDTNGNNVTLATAMSGSGALTKNGTGALRLTASNTYTGGTVINSGSLVVAANNALGSGGVRVQGGTLAVEDGLAFSNGVILAGGTYRRTVTGNLAGMVNSTSDLAGGTDTSARILAGSLGSTSTLITSFSATSSASNDFLRETDVYSFVGTGTSTFVLELGSVSLTEGKVVWLSNGEWVNAIDGNIGNTATLAMQGFDGSYTEFLATFSGFTLSQTIGAYGYDEETHAAWAVLNHNSDFAVVPEPGTVGLLVMGAVVVFGRRRRQVEF